MRSDARTATLPRAPLERPASIVADPALAQLLASIDDDGGASALGAPVIGADALHQRSLCYRLHLADGRSVFAKQALLGADGRHSADVAAEGRVLADLVPYAIPAPRPLVVVESAQLVVMQDLAGRATPDQRRRDAGGSSPQWARAYGAALGRVHAAAASHAAPRSPGSTHPFAERAVAPQLVSSWIHVTPSAIASYPAGFAEKTRRIRALGLHPLLIDAAARWRPSALIHGDVKSDNVLCGADPERADGLMLIDWETAGWGDPRWDVGCLIGDYLYSWLSSMRFDSGDSLDAWIETAAPALPQVRDELRAAVAAYGEHCPVEDEDRRLWLAFAAMFLLQRLSSSALQSAVLPPTALAFLQVAAQLLRRPQACTEMLL